MWGMGFPSHIVRLYEDQQAAVKLASGITRWFDIGRGVRQGCILSPHYFGLYRECVMREGIDSADLKVEETIRVGGHNIKELRYADDTVLFSTSAVGLNKLISAVKSKSENYDLHLNVKKNESDDYRRAA